MPDTAGLLRGAALAAVMPVTAMVPATATVAAAAMSRL